MPINQNAEQKQRASGTSPDTGGKEIFQVSAPSLSLPKGGGAIRGIGEKFAANPVTGTGSLTVTIYTSPGRSGFGPQLFLSYDSGSGNGPFGFGWSLALPSITRKTDKGLPRYVDAQESDTFILSGVEDLVPTLIKDAQDHWVPEVVRDRTVNNQVYRIQRYRPRVEGLFARIERWTNESDPTDIFWRSISKDNITSWYGKTPESRIADPTDPTRIFTWLICESYDDKGSVIVYGYKDENSDGVDLSQAHERNRTETTRSANRYPKRIRYGNHTPFLPTLSAVAPWPTPPGATALDGCKDWFFELVFDYGEHDDQAPVPQETGKPWECRKDPFSAYRATFEVRTYRLCRRTLMFHHFQADPGVGLNCLVRSTDLTHSQFTQPPADPTKPFYSYLLSVTQTGHRRNANGSYLSKALPPLEFTYTEAAINETVQDVDAESLQNLPYGLDGSHYQWVDLDGEGLSGILTEQAGSWFYKPNLSPVNQNTDNGVLTTRAQFGPVQCVARQPSLAALGSGRQQLLDLAGDGQLDLVEFSGPTPGFFERTEDDDWEPFAPFTSLPDLDWGDPNLKFVDVTGDGHPDVLISKDDAFCWHESLVKAGFGPEQRVLQARDEERGPKLVFADSTQSIFLADLSGDGLTDLVRIRNGEVCYWPNLGYGRFGAKVTMDNAPWFEAPDLFDGRRIRLTDIDGSATTDIIYFASSGVHLYFNQSGNAWGGRRALGQFPSVESVSSATALDLLGNGTACLVWSSPLPANARRPMQYIDLMGRQKPHLLVKVTNNLGAETRVQYAPSTQFYVADKVAGTPWITRLPFPVHVVERVATYDYVSRNRFVTRYAYHHGFYDGIEREFRGFGMVEQFDSEEFAALTATGAFPHAANIDEVSQVPPVCTKTWFHTGAYLGEERISKHFEEEYYHEGDTSDAVGGLTDEQLEAMLLDDTVLPTTLLLPDGTRVPYDLTGDEACEAARALKGSILRQEIYAVDGTDAADRPYTASERNYTIEVLQPQGPNRHAVFFAHAREAIDFHYERKLFKVSGGALIDPNNPPADAKDAADPRVTHALTLEVDDYGNVLKAASIGYGRRFDASDPALLPQDRDTQRLIYITHTESLVTNPIDDVNKYPDDYRVPLPCETRTYELRKPEQEKSSNGMTQLYRINDLLGYVHQAGDGKHDVAYEDFEFAKAKQAAADDPGEGKKYFRRLIEQVRTFFRPNDMGVGAGDPRALLSLGQLQSLALPGISYKPAFTPGLLSQVYQRGQENLLPVPANVLGGTGPDRGGYVDFDRDRHWWIPSGRIFHHPDPRATAQQELDQARQHFFLPRRFEDPFGQSSTVDYDEPLDLLAVRTTDAAKNTVAALNDYRVLQPTLVTDPNDNRAAVRFDALGLVAGTAVMGKTTENLGDSLDTFAADLSAQQVSDFFDAHDPHDPAGPLLGTATTRIIYDVDRFKNTCDANPNDPSTWEPVFAATVARETHSKDPLPQGDLKIQISFSYSDGFGREIQKKIQAEPGPVIDGGLVIDPRWVGSGWTIFNNKGKPVRQYEPFFSQLPTKGHQFEFGVTVGVSPILCYDPVRRVVATIHPNHTYEKVVFDPWQHTTWDVNDTVLQPDSRNDSDVGDFFRLLPETDFLPTWYALRTDPTFATQAAQLWPDPTIRDAEADAAAKAAIHANTPTIAYFDTLGRTFLTIANNRFERQGTTVEENYPTRVALDIEGNQREVRDAIVQADDQQGRIVMQYDYDMLGNRIHQASMEAGERWMLNDVTGKSIRAWNSRGQAFRTEYDPLRRPSKAFVQGADAQNPNREILFEQTVYGEGQPNDKTLNSRTRVFKHFDAAGVVTSLGPNPITNRDEAYDFKGNLLRGSRELAPDYKGLIDWNVAQPLGEVFSTSTIYDALNRPTALTTPDKSVYRPTYNEANLLDKVNVNLRGATTATPFVTNIDYNAKGQRTQIDYGNGASMAYEYDDQTFRLINLKTTRPAGLNGLASQLFKSETTVQDLHYTYDPAGNITRIADDSLPVIVYDNQQVDPVCDYTCDAIYRLIEAKGREHIGQTAFQPNPPNGDLRDYPFAGLNASPNDIQALRNYTEQYEYDAVGNFEQLIHQAANGSWTRGYAYNEDSLLERTTKKSNRLSNTTVGQATDTYAYDAHGNMTQMPQLTQMQWDFKDQLRTTSRQVNNDGTPETTFYVYDASGQRLRKVTARQNGTRKDERIYLGGFEVYREYEGTGNAVTLVRETLKVMDDKQRIALLETKTITNPNDDSPAQLIRYQFGNHLGSASLELDDQAQVISYEEYYPYGSTSYQAVNKVIKAAVKRYRYTGKERDEETGFYYHAARYYAAWLGRWSSCDPKGMIDGANLYTYVGNRPVNRVDRTGAQGDETQKPSFGERFRQGLVQGAKAAMEDLYNAPFTPLAIVGQVKTGVAMVEAFQKEKSIGAGLAMAANVINPAYHAAVAAYKSQKAAREGKYGEATAQGVFAAVGVVQTVGLALGAAGAARGAFKPSATTGEGIAASESTIKPTTKPNAGLPEATKQPGPGPSPEPGPGPSQLPGPGPSPEPGPGLSPEPGPATSPEPGPGPSPEIGLSSRSPKPGKIYIEKYITDVMQEKVDIANAERDVNPRAFFGYDITQSPQWQLRLEGGHLMESRAGELIAPHPVGKLVEPIPHAEQSAGRGMLGDFRLRPQYQQMWNLKQWDVTTPGAAMRKMEAGADRYWLTYPTFRR